MDFSHHGTLYYGSIKPEPITSLQDIESNPAFISLPLSPGVCLTLYLSVLMCILPISLISPIISTICVELGSDNGMVGICYSIFG